MHRFQSTLSSQRVTLHNGFQNRIDSISIHTLLAESDDRILPMAKLLYYFNPHSPRREWLTESALTLRDTFISIHTLLAESDRSRDKSRHQYRNFNPHSPRREWPKSVPQKSTGSKKISIHTLLAESDQWGYSACWKSFRFQSTLSSQRVTRVA